MDWILFFIVLLKATNEISSLQDAFPQASYLRNHRNIVVPNDGKNLAPPPSAPNAPQQPPQDTTTASSGNQPPQGGKDSKPAESIDRPPILIAPAESPISPTGGGGGNRSEGVVSIPNPAAMAADPPLSQIPTPDSPMLIAPAGPTPSTQAPPPPPSTSFGVDQSLQVPPNMPDTANVAGNPQPPILLAPEESPPSENPPKEASTTQNGGNSTEAGNSNYSTQNEVEPSKSAIQATATNPDWIPEERIAPGFERSLNRALRLNHRTPFKPVQSGIMDTLPKRKKGDFIIVVTQRSNDFPSSSTSSVNEDLQTLLRLLRNRGRAQTRRRSG